MSGSTPATRPGAGSPPAAAPAVGNGNGGGSAPVGGVEPVTASSRRDWLAHLICDGKLPREALATVEVLSGSRASIRTALPLRGLLYDRKRDVFEIALEYGAGGSLLRYFVIAPRMVRVECGPRGAPAQIVVEDAEGDRTLVTAYPPRRERSGAREG